MGGRLVGSADLRRSLPVASGYRRKTRVPHLTVAGPHLL